MTRRLLLLPLLALVLSCQTVPRADGPRRVVLLSIDGAGSDELRRLWRAGELDAGGFARFFREGQVADGLVAVNPSLTAPNHISLATGYTTDRTGIVANTLHLPDAKVFTELGRGFEIPIGTETLWEAAQRQGKRVGVSTFPGADGNGPRRTADWGLIYVNDPDRAAELVVLERVSWEETSGGVTARVELAPGKPETQTFELRAHDGNGDGAYDGIAVQGGPGPLAPGAWQEVPCRLTVKSQARDAVCPVKLLEMAPDLRRVRLYFGGVFSLRAYPEGFLAALERRNLYWPGPPDDRRLSDTWAGRPGIDLATWTEQNERFARFFGDALLAAAAEPGWDLLMGYTPVIDEARHQLMLTDPRQPGYSPERRAEHERAQIRVWKAVDREIARLLAAVDPRNTVVVLVSDHGMSPVHTAVDPNVLLRERKLLANDARGWVTAEGTDVYAIGSGGVSHVYFKPERRDLIPALRQQLEGWTVGGERIVERVFTREEASQVQLNHPNSGDLILFFRPGYSAHGGLLDEGTPTAPTTVYGMHGYLNTHPEMNGIFLALGPGIRRGNPGTLRNTDVAGRVADWMGIEKPREQPPQ